MNKKNHQLKVYLSEMHIGHLTKQLNGAIEFEYTDEWVKSGYSISLSLPLERKKFKGEEASFYFDNLLPDNKLILEAIAGKFKAQSTKQFDILSVIGRDCVGALSFFNKDETPDSFKKLKIRPIKDSAIAKKIKGLAYDSPLGMDERDFRISLAGAQEKMALLRWKKNWYEPLKQTPTSHIIKKQMGKLAGGLMFDESVDNEYICLHLAKHFGIKSCDATIETFEKERVLCVKRFDRVWLENNLLRIPQEDMCQALGHSPLLKYERDNGPGLKDLLDLLKTSNNSDRDRKELFKIAMFNDLTFNTDGHAKNISIFVTKKGFAMTPTYDLLSAHFIKPQSLERYKVLRSSLSVNGKYPYCDISLKDWEAEAKKCDLSPEVFKQICNELKEAIENLSQFRLELPTSQKMLALILEGVKARALELFN